MAATAPNTKSGAVTIPSPTALERHLGVRSRRRLARAELSAAYLPSVWCRLGGKVDGDVPLEYESEHAARMALNLETDPRIADVAWA